MAQILAFTAACPRPAASRPAPQGPRLGAFHAIALVPALVVAGSIGMVDACAFTQHSLLGLYGTAASLAA